MLDLLIIGGGPTGINIAVEAEKAGLNYLIIEKGVLVNSLFHFPANMTFFSTSKNLEIVDIPFISHTEKPTRKEALEYYRRIVDSYQLKIHFYEEVLELEKKENFVVKTSKETYVSRQVVICTGFYDKPRMLGVPGEELPKVKHYYDEAHPYVGQKVLVIGAANSACDVALETWHKGSDVTMVVRGSGLKEKVKYWILPNIKNRIEEGSIKAYFRSEVTAIREDQVDIKTAEGGTVTVENDFVLAMTGYTPDYDLLEKLKVPLTDDEAKAPDFDVDTFETTCKGMYVAGVINAGLHTSKLFIENTRHHASAIVNHILSKQKMAYTNQ